MNSFLDGEYEPGGMWSREAEMSVLGSMLTWDTAADEAIGLLDVKHFFAPGHRGLFAFMRDMRQRGEHIDWRTLSDRLKLVNRLADVGGESYIVDLALYVVSPSHCATYCQMVREWWRRRQIVELGAKAQSEDVTPEELILKLEELTSDSRQGAPIKSGSIGEFIGRKRKTGVPTGFGFIDTQTTCQGLPEGQMSVVVADTGHGKTAFSLLVALNAASRGIPVLYATFADMDGHDLADRLMKNRCGRVNAPTENHPDFERYHESAKHLSGLPFDVYDAVDMDSGRDVETFAAWFKAKQARRDRPWRLVVVDYAQELSSRSVKARSKFDEAEECAQVVRVLAAKTNVAFVVGSQMTAGNEKAGTKDITKGSRVWMERAALILRLQVFSDEERKSLKVEDQYKCIPGLTEVRMMKNRFGQRGGKEFWRWLPETATFMELG